jgi:putative PIN family toxin of toxin-antitoxin system
MADLRFVFDTNVTISAALLKDSVPREALDLARRLGTILISLPTIDELQEVLGRTRFDRYIGENERMLFLESLAREAVLIDIVGTITDCRDPKDNKFLELAAEGNAACLVTGDKDLLVLNPFRYSDTDTKRLPRPNLDIGEPYRHLPAGSALLQTNMIRGFVKDMPPVQISSWSRPLANIALAALAVALVIAGNPGPACGGPPVAARDSHFRFQDNFWVNLHHFVRAEARRRAFGAVPILALTSLSDPERVAWTAALDAYTELANKSLIFDLSLVAINNALAVRKDEDKLPAGIVDPAVTAALNRAAPVFRAHLWPEVRRVNDAWIVQFSALAEQHATKLVPALAGAYHVTWPKGPVLVDTSIETGPTLAYTTGGPPGTAGHTTIAPTKTQDLYVALETLFHEASHVVDDQITRAVEEEGARQHVKALPDLWHGIIFFTAGELVRRELGKAGDATYQPYAVRFGIWERGWQTIHAALEREWLPYLDGKVSYEKALPSLVAAASTPLPEKPRIMTQPPVATRSRHVNTARAGGARRVVGFTIAG